MLYTHNYLLYIITPIDPTAVYMFLYSFLSPAYELNKYRMREMDKMDNHLLAD